MDVVDALVVGGGASGLSFANWYRGESLVVEAEAEPGGYCRTVARDGFVWDYSGHFFHFKDKALEAWLRERMTGDIRTVTKLSFIRYAGRDIDFPFQKNIHQLPQDELVECLVDLYFARPDAQPASFLAMLYGRLGKAITEKFLRPYNEKLYATDLDALDVDAMGRFFPHADVADIIGNMRPGQKDGGYNATFTYPRGGAMQYIHALLRDIPPVACNERVVAIDLAAKTARTTRREVKYRHLVSSAPLPALARMCGIPFDDGAFTSNKVLVFNLGFDGKGRSDVHWMYFPDRARVFYRVGWYDNIFAADRMSLYVEIGLAHGDSADVAAARARVLADLRAEGIVTTQQLVAEHSVILDPAYCHITKRSLAETTRIIELLRGHGVYSVGRYGRWTYCSIEDNMLETRQLASELMPPGS